MEPRIRYAKTQDGAAIAFWTAGAGVDLVHLPWLPWGHAQLEWQNPELNLWYERLSARCRLIRYDGRGSGLSDRESPDYGLEAQLADLEAVIDRLELSQAALLASLNMGPAAITYASRHPERVSGIMLWCTYANAAEYTALPRVSALRSLMATDFDLYTESAAHAFLGWASDSSVNEITAVMRQSTTEAIARQFYEDMSDVDCTPLLAGLTLPVLVMHPREYPLIDLGSIRRLAAAIPDARLELFEGRSLSPTRGDLDGVVRAIVDFANETARAPAAASAASTAAEPAREWPNADGLSGREIEVLGLLARGLSNREIADLLVLSPRTVERHIENIYAKVRVNNRAQAAAYAVSNELA